MKINISNFNLIFIYFLLLLQAIYEPWYGKSHMLSFKIIMCRLPVLNVCCSMLTGCCRLHLVDRVNWSSWSYVDDCWVEGLVPTFHLVFCVCPAQILGRHIRICSLENDWVTYSNCHILFVIFYFLFFCRVKNEWNKPATGWVTCILERWASNRYWKLCWHFNIRVTCHSYTFLQQPSFYLSIDMLNKSFYSCPLYIFMLENDNPLCHIVVLLHNPRLTLPCIFQF